MAKRIAGLHEHRFKDNPEEKRFAMAWAELEKRRHLSHLLNEGDCRFPLTPSVRDSQVAATVIQWLGSPVGQGWLAEMGYERCK